MALTLYHAPQSRSGRTIWLLEELGVPYELKIVEIRRQGGKGGPDDANPHPHGKVPAIRHDGELVYESAAIFAYLTDAFPEKGLGPLPGAQGRGAYLSWLAYYAGVIEPAMTAKFMNLSIPPGGAAWPDISEALAHITATLDRQPYLLGDRFSAADVLYGSTFNFFFMVGALDRTPVLDAYTKRCVERPAFATSQARDNG